MWTKEQETLLAQLWAKGLTLSQCGKRLGYTRNAVAGKVRRMKLEYRDLTNSHRARRVPKKAARRKLRRRVSGPSAGRLPSLPSDTPPEPDPAPTSLTLLELKRGNCRFITNHVPDILRRTFCGRRTI